MDANPNVARYLDVPLVVEAEFDRPLFRLADLVGFRADALVAANRPPTDQVVLTVDGIAFAEGELFCQEDRIAVRITALRKREMKASER